MRTIPHSTDTLAVDADHVAVLRHLDEVAGARLEVLEHELAEPRQILEHRGSA